VIAKAGLNDKEKKVIQQKIRTNLEQPKSIVNEKTKKWTRYGTDFEFNSDAFHNLKSKESRYKYIYGTSDEHKNSDYTLIVTMMSHETKKLIEESK
jgi:hypothetical protein